MRHEATHHPQADAVRGERVGDVDVLVVDDDPRNVRAIDAVLRDIDARPTYVGSGAEALRLLLQREFAVILLDVRMPGMDGFETAQLVRTRERTRHVPIIFMTAYGEDESHIRRAYELGAVDYLVKPIVPVVLRAKVQIFVALRAHGDAIARQAEQLRQAERLAGIRALEEERSRWEADALRRQVEEQRLQNERLAELDERKDQFIAQLAHELRNPLTPIAMGLELIALRRPTDPAIARARDSMEAQVAHLTRLVDDLLDSARITQGKLELRKGPVRLRDVVDRAIDMCRLALERAGHALAVEACDHDIVLDADAVRLTQVVSNLLNNAIRYSEPGGRIALAWGEDDGRAFISVADDGSGIDEAFLGRVFDRFAQEHPGGSGLGLGLALVRDLVELHGGSVRAESDGPGTGSVFIVHLPMATGARPQADATDDDAASDATRPRRGPSLVPLRVVVIEDDEDIREAITGVLTMWGHEVAGTSADGASGVDLVLDVRPDVCIVDVGLPTLDGYEVAARIRDALGRESPRLVAMTGYGQAGDRQRATRAGFDAHLVKPSTPEQLRSVLQGVETE